MSSTFEPSSTLLHDLHHDLTFQIFEYLTIQDLLRIEACSKSMNESVQNHWNALERRQTSGNSIAFTAKDRICRYQVANAKAMECLERSYQPNRAFIGCPGCCTCPDFDPKSVHFMEYFLWIGGPDRSHTATASTYIDPFNPTKCIWRGFVRCTSSSLLLNSDIQRALEAKSPEFAELLAILTEKSNASETLDRASTPRLEEAIERFTSSVSIHVVALPYDTKPRQPWVIMEATPASRHLQVHWDDSSYNPEYATLAWLMSTTQIGNNVTSNRENRRRFSCMHLWFQVSNIRPACLLRVNMDKCCSPDLEMPEFDENFDLISEQQY